MVASVRAWGTLAHGTGDVVAVHGTHVAGDVLAMFIASDTDTITAPSGWEIRGSIFLSGICLAYARRNTYATSSAESNPTVPDAGNHTAVLPFTLQDADLDEHMIAGCSTQGSSTTGRTPFARTKQDDQFILCALASGLDTTSAICSAVVNSDITGLAEAFDGATDDGNGSAIVVATGTKATPGKIKPTEFTITASNTVGLIISIAPKRATPHAGVFRLRDGSPVPNGTDVVRIVDMTQTDDHVVTSISGGSGAYSALVRFADHQYVAIHNDGTTRGVTAPAVP